MAGHIAGIIEKLELTNFMCHSHLSMDFNPNINFIVGKNGSGKSALMTALMIVLGVKAQDTSRAKSLSNFIRLGCNQARVKVILRNVGSNAYKQDKYGNHIVIVRVLNKNSSRFTLETLNGIEHCTASELKNILHALNIKLPNPFALMTQETMKTFFMSSNTQDMYDLVREGTGMKDAQLKTQDLKESLEKGKKEEEALKKCLEYVEDEYKVWLKKKEYVNKMEKSKDVIADLEKEVLWAQVITEETTLKSVQERMQKFINQKIKIQKSLETQRGKQEDLLQKIREMNEEINGWKAQQMEKEEEQKKLKIVYETKDKLVIAAKGKLQAMERQLQVKNSEKKALQDDIKKLVQRSSQEEVDRRELKRRQREDMERELIDVQATRITLENELERMRGEARNCQNMLNKIRYAVQEQMQLCKNKQQELSMAKNQSSSLSPAYGHRMPDFLREIDKAYANRKFTMKPIGPIGAHVKVKDQMWALAVESILNSEMRNFFCNSEQDRRVLMEIWKRVMPGNYSPTVVVSPFQEKPFDVTETRTESYGELLSLLDVLDVQNPIILNYLIDQKSVEHISLCNNLNYVLDIMQDCKRVPRNCHMVVTPEAEQIMPVPIYRYYNSDIRKVTYLVANKEDGIRGMETAVLEEEAKLAETEAEVGQYEKESMRIKQELSRTHSQLRRVEEKDAKLRNTIRSYKAEEEEIADQGIVADLEREVESSQQEILSLDEERRFLQTELNQAKEAKKEQEGLLRALIPSCTTVKNNFSACQRRKVELENKLDEERNRESSYRNECADLTVREVQLTNEVVHQERMVEEAENIAIKACPRINTRNSIQCLQQKIAGEKKFIESMHNKLQEDPEAIKSKVQELSAKKIQMTQLVKPVADALEHFEESLEERKHRYHNAMRCTIGSIENTFRVLIRRQHFEGKLTFDHRQRELKIILNMKGKQKNTLKNLSGGERSFTTIALILSVWDKLRIPFFMLDEFDVFMDMVNRRICSDMLIEEAKNSQGRQFIFFTPQEMEMLATDRITIHKLADPRDA